MTLRIIATLALLAFILTGCSSRLLQMRVPESETVQKQAEVERAKREKEFLDNKTEAIREKSALGEFITADKLPGENPPPAEKGKMIHIVRAGDGGMVEMWLDLLKDDFELNMKFNEQSGNPIITLNKDLRSPQDPSRSDSRYDSRDSRNSRERYDNTTREYRERTIVMGGSGKDGEFGMDDTPLEESGAALSPEAVGMIDQYILRYENAQKFFYLRQYDAALKNVNEAISISPTVALAHKLRGSILYKMEKYERAAAAWTRALELDPGAEDVILMLKEVGRKIK